jgi:tetratricopeptide (TPR) repeat protein
MNQGDLIKKFEELLTSNSRSFFDSDEFDILIDFFLTANQQNKALKALDFALEQYPYSIDFIIRKAQILSANKETIKALGLLEQAEALSPLHPEIFMSRGSIYSLIGLPEKAIENFKKSIQHAGGAKDIIEDAYLYLSFEYENLEQYEDAMFCLKKTININPSNNAALYELAFCYEVNSKDNEAVEFFNSFLDKHSYSDCTWFNLGVVYNRMGLFEKAIEAYDYVIAIKEDFAPAYFNKANSLANLDNLKEAISCYEETFKHEKPEAITYCYIGECYEKLKNFDQSLVNYNRATALDQNLADAWIGMGIVLDQQNRLTEGIHYLKKAINIDKTNGDYWYVIGDAYQKLGFTQEAKDAYQKVTEFDPSLENIWLDYSNLLYEEGDKEEAVEVLGLGIKHHPDNAELFYRMAACLLWSGKKQEALTYLQSALQLDYKKHKEIFKFIPELRKNRSVLDMIKSYRKR